jgi:hypothetical protein
MSIYPPTPELDWIQDLVEEANYPAGAPISQWEADALFNVHQFLLWFGRMQRADPKSREYLVAYGYALRYREQVYRRPLTDAERKSVAAAEEGYAELKKERKKCG